MPNGPPTQREWEDLRRRVDRIDQEGTRPAQSVQEHLERLDNGLEKLNKRLDDEKQERKFNRRWLIGAAFTAVVVVTTVVSFIATYVFHVH